MSDNFTGLIVKILSFGFDFTQEELIDWIGTLNVSIQSRFKCKIAECTCGFGTTITLPLIV